MSETIQFLTASQVMTIQHAMLIRYGGRPGVIDPAALASAIAQPRAGMFGQYLHNSLPKMAEAYYFYLHKNRPFYCHNQKTAFLSANIFLQLNRLPGEFELPK